MNNTKDLTERTGKKICPRFNKYSKGVRVTAVFLALIMAFSALGANLSTIMDMFGLLTVKAADAADDLYPATITLYDFYSDDEIMGCGLEKYGRSQYSVFNHALYDSGYASMAGTKDDWDRGSIGWSADSLKNDNATNNGLNYFPLYLGLQYPGASNFMEKDDYNYSMTANSEADSDPSGAATGLVDRTLSNGVLTQGGGMVAVPYFDTNFIQTKVKNVLSSTSLQQYTTDGFTIDSQTLGKVSSTGTFKFRKVGDVYQYFSYDADTTKYQGLKYTAGTGTDLGTYEVGPMEPWNDGTNSSRAGAGNWSGGSSTQYFSYKDDKSHPGFFPWNYYNKRQDASSSSTQYGYAAKFDIEFSMSKDGALTSGTNKGQPIKFDFKGDDDVWVFIDGQLILDVGGAHGAVSGNIDFKAKTATTKNVKTSTYYNRSGDATAGAGTTANGGVRDISDVLDSIGLYDDATAKHTITVFYVERGTIESNCLISFNFQSGDTVSVVNKIDTKEVNPKLKDAAAAVAATEGMAYMLQSNSAKSEVGSPDAVPAGETFAPSVYESDFSSSSSSQKYTLSFITDYEKAAPYSSGDVNSSLTMSDITSGTKVKLPAAACINLRPGYYVSGWQLLDGSGYPGTMTYNSYTVRNNATFVAVWRPIEVAATELTINPPMVMMVNNGNGGSVPKFDGIGSGDYVIIGANTESDNNSISYINFTKKNASGTVTFDYGDKKWGSWALSPGNVYNLVDSGTDHYHSKPIASYANNSFGTATNYSKWTKSYVNFYNAVSSRIDAINAALSTEGTITYGGSDFSEELKTAIEKYPTMLPNDATYTQSKLDSLVTKLTGATITNGSAGTSVSYAYSYETVEFYVYSPSGNPTIDITNSGYAANLGNNNKNITITQLTEADMPNGADTATYAATNYYKVTVPKYIEKITTVTDKNGSTSTELEQIQTQISIADYGTLKSETLANRVASSLSGQYYCYYVPEAKWRDITDVPAKYDAANTLSFYVYSAGGTPTVTITNASNYSLTSTPASISITQLTSADTLPSGANLTYYSKTNYYYVTGVPKYIIKNIDGTDTSIPTIIQANTAPSLNAETLATAIANATEQKYYCCYVSENEWHDITDISNVPSSYYSGDTTLFWVFNKDGQPTVTYYPSGENSSSSSAVTVTATGPMPYCKAYKVPIAYYTDNGTTTKAVHVKIGTDVTDLNLSTVITDSSKAYCYTYGNNVTDSPTWCNLVTIFNKTSNNQYLHIWRTDKVVQNQTNDGYPDNSFKWSNPQTMQTAGDTGYYYYYLPYISISGASIKFMDQRGSSPELILINEDQVLSGTSNNNATSLSGYIDESALLPYTASYLASQNNKTAPVSGGSATPPSSGGSAGGRPTTPPASGAGSNYNASGQFAGATGGNYATASGVNFKLYNSDDPNSATAGSVIRQTGADGKFYLHQDQSAKFTYQFNRNTGLKIAQTGDSRFFAPTYITTIQTGEKELPQTTAGQLTTNTVKGEMDSQTKGLFNRYKTTWTISDQKDGKVISTSENYNAYLHGGETYKYKNETAAAGDLNANFLSSTSSDGALYLDNIKSAASATTDIILTATFYNSVLTGDLYIKKLISESTQTAAAAYRASNATYNPEFKFAVNFSKIFGGSATSDYQGGIYYYKDTSGNYYAKTGTAADGTETATAYKRTKTEYNEEDGSVTYTYALVSNPSTTLTETIAADGTITGGHNIARKTDDGKISLRYTEAAQEKDGTSTVSGGTIKMIVIEGVPVETTYSIAETLPTKGNAAEPDFDFAKATAYDVDQNGAFNTTATTSLSISGTAPTKTASSENAVISVTSNKLVTESKSLAKYYKVTSTGTYGGSDTRVDVVNGVSIAYIILTKNIDHLYYYTTQTPTGSSNSDNTTDNPADLADKSYKVGGAAGGTDDYNGYQGATGAEQSFIFTVQEYSDAAMTTLTNEFQKVISFGSGDGLSKSVYIKADPAKWYKITEQDAWSWKYKLDTSTVTDKGTNSNNADGAVVVVHNFKATATINGTEYNTTDTVIFYNIKQNATGDDAKKDVEGDTSVKTNIIEKTAAS